jgi:hypothetical protein
MILITFISTLTVRWTFRMSVVVICKIKEILLISTHIFHVFQRTLHLYWEMTLMMIQLGLWFTLIFWRMTVLQPLATVLISKTGWLQQDAARPPYLHSVPNYRRKHSETECFETDSLIQNRTKQRFGNWACFYTQVRIYLLRWVP